MRDTIRRTERSVLHIKRRITAVRKVMLDLIHDAVWICNDCERTFREPKRNIGNSYPFVVSDSDVPDEYECPYCGSDDFQLAEWCAECDTVHRQSELNMGLCPDCLDKLIKDHGHEYIMSDKDLMDEFAWWWHKKRRG
jgi:Zn finger protein HypA/HybF involved in hydrogenase expression